MQTQEGALWIKTRSSSMICNRSTMAETNFMQAAIPRFDGHYDHWSMLMENFLRSKEYWQVVDSGIAEPETGVILTEAQLTELSNLKLKDLKAKNYLFQAIDRSILETILSKDTSKQIWDSMKKKYQGSSRVKRSQLQALRRDFETLQMKDGESVTEYCAKTMGISNKMRFHGEKMNDTVIVEKILRSLSSKFDYVACSIEESKDIEALSLDELQSSLLVHEQKMKRSTITEEHALKASTFTESSHIRGRGRGRSRGRGFRDNKDGGRGRGREQSFNRTNVECYRCHIIGHYQSDCYTRLPHSKEKRQKSNFTENKEEETLLMAFHTKDNISASDVWYLDTGCSNHMCGSKSFFSNLNEEFHTTVSFGDHSKVDVMGKGDIQIRTKKNTIETISNVFYIPDLKSNLLSLGQLQEKGYVTTIKNGVCDIYDPTRGLVAHDKMTPNRLFPLQIQTLQHCLVAKEVDSTWLWHYRYGHLNFNGLKTLYQKNMVIGLPTVTHLNKVCEHCVVGKHIVKNFHKDQHGEQRKSWSWCILICVDQ